MKKTAGHTILLYNGLLRLEHDPATETLLARLPVARKHTRMHKHFQLILTHLHTYGIRKLLLVSTSPVEADPFFTQGAFAAFVDKLHELGVQKLAYVCQKPIQLPLPLEGRGFTTTEEAMLWLMNP